MIIETPRPLQNRVDPFGDFHAVAAWGALMGNRAGGCIATTGRSPGRWTSKRWIACRCAFGGGRRDVWGDSYTELFFLDEPTALAAGHSACYECRREAAKAFLAAFPGAPGNADAMDAALHGERLAGRRKRVWRSRLAELPDSAMVALDGRPHAICAGGLPPWSFAGYGSPVARDARLEVDVLTPRCSVLTIAAGYRPQWAQPIALNSASNNLKFPVGPEKSGR